MPAGGTSAFVAEVTLELMSICCSDPDRQIPDDEGAALTERCLSQSNAHKAYLLNDRVCW